MASKSKKRRRVLGASCILAALIIAGSSFAWFTSKDEVTNRLTANADYDVSIVESFAPPKNFLPGQEVNKDVYATNTGTIGAFVKETVSTKLSITKEVPVEATLGTKTETINGKDVTYDTGKLKDDNPLKYKTAGDTALTDCIELDYDEVYVREAGSFLVYKPHDSKAKLGDIAVNYVTPQADTVYQYVATDTVASVTTTYYISADTYQKAFEPAEGQSAVALTTDASGKNIPDALKGDSNKGKWSKVEKPAAKTDFTPDAEGLYVFRRAIDVDYKNAEQFDYEAYYYKDGHYYKVTNLAVTPDNVADFSNDDVFTDGIIDSATFSLVKEVKDVVVPTMTYDQANNRLVVTYGGYDETNGSSNSRTQMYTDLETLAEALDTAEHQWVEARAALDRALSEKATSDANVAKDMAAIQALEAELAKVQARITTLESLIGSSADGLTKRVNDLTTTVANDKSNLENKMKALYGDSKATSYDVGTGAFSVTENRNSDNPDNFQTGGNDSAYAALLRATSEYNAAKTAYTEDVYLEYLADLKAKYGTGGTAVPASPTAEQTAAAAAISACGTLDEAVALLTYDQLKNEVNPYVNNTDKHNLYQKMVALLKAQHNYDLAYKDAADALGKYKSDYDQLGNAKQDSGTAKTETIGGYTVDYNEYTSEANTTQQAGATAASGLRKELQDLENEKKSLDEKKDSLNTQINAAYNQAADDATVTGATASAADNLANAIDTYNTKYAEYIAAQNAYNAKKAEYDAAKNFKIYINLADVVTEGGIKDKWQIVPVDTVNAITQNEAETNNKDTAYFYYTSILPSGETSAKLIDSVELAEDVTQDMYKSFDFDINVGLDSRQIAYDKSDAGKLTDESLADFGATVTFDNNRSEDTALTWTNVAP